MTQDFTLIADAGATKTAWALLQHSTGDAFEYTTAGINAATGSDEHITNTLLELNGWLDGRTPARVFFYGAGCVSPETCSRVSHPMLRLWPDARVEVASDMLGACRAMCGRKRGVVCMLGTGSNSARYDGKKITRNVPPMGFILGDEGSGVAIGKRLVSDIYKGVLPRGVKTAFEKQTGLKYEDVIHRTYREEAPARFLASLAPFVKENMTRYPDLREMVMDEFDSFLDRNLTSYDLSLGASVYFVGSIAFYFSMELVEACMEHGYSIGRVALTPIPGLIEYHRTL